MTILLIIFFIVFLLIRATIRRARGQANSMEEIVDRWRREQRFSDFLNRFPERMMNTDDQEHHINSQIGQTNRWERYNKW